MAESPNEPSTPAYDDGRETGFFPGTLEAGAWLCAVIENSVDAIISKTLDGTIMSWNTGAERLFGYTAREAIGQPITIIIPDNRLGEEATIMARLHAGERVEDFATIRRHKDGSERNIVLTVSPVRGEGTVFLGASAIVRDMSPIIQTAERQNLMIREMNHRIKNLFALTTSLVALSARSASDVHELVDDLIARLQALSRAHALSLPDLYGEALGHKNMTLPALIGEVLAPYAEDENPSRFSISGAPVLIGHRAIPTLGLLFHEFATNAAKHGALAAEEGQLTVLITAADDIVEVLWREERGPQREIDTPVLQGFGSRLEKASLTGLQGTLDRFWQDRGLEIRVCLPLSKIGN